MAVVYMLFTLKGDYINGTGMDEFEKLALEVHNHYRASHHATPLTWNPSLAREAQAWAERLAQEDRLKHASTDDGENIYMSFGETKVTGDVAVDKWYQEVKEYSFSRPGFQSNTGHFTQIVWRGSKELGVGKAQGYDGKVFVVARYRPPGNNLRTFEENVLPAQKHLPQRSPTGWELLDQNGYEPFTNTNHSKRNSGYRDFGLGVEPIDYRGSRYSERWDPVYVKEKETPKRASESYKKSYNQHDPSKKTPADQRWNSKINDKNSESYSSNRYSVGRDQDRFINHKWDSGKWFEDNTIKPTTNLTQQSSPAQYILTDSTNVKNKQKKDKSIPKRSVTDRWQPKENQNHKKDLEKFQPWKGELQSKSYHRDSVDRNKSCNKVRASTEKWESLRNGELETDGGPTKDNKVGRARTQESIKRWEQQNFDQPVSQYQPHRFSKSTSNLIQPNQSKQLFSERWDPLWGDQPLNEDRPRPVSWDGGKFAENHAYSNPRRLNDEPSERKITTTIVDGPKKTIVSSVTITLKGNETPIKRNNTKSKSTEDLRRPKNSYSRNTSTHSHVPVQEVYTEQRAARTNTRPKSEDFSLRSNEWDTRRPVEEGPIVPVTKIRSDFTDGFNSYHDTIPLKTFPSLDHFSQEGLECHNVYRALHGAPNLMWSAELAHSAQQWAEKLARERTLRHAPRERGADGENLAMFSGKFKNAAKEAIDMWYNESQNYNFSRPGYQPRSGHFTQLVWKDSKEFGMGRALTSDGQLTVVVCRYRPAGNVLRQYEPNVFPPLSFF